MDRSRAYEADANRFLQRDRIALLVDVSPTAGQLLGQVVDAQLVRQELLERRRRDLVLPPWVVRRGLERRGHHGGRGLEGLRPTVRATSGLVDRVARGRRRRDQPVALPDRGEVVGLHE